MRPPSRSTRSFHTRYSPLYHTTTKEKEHNTDTAVPPSIKSASSIPQKKRAHVRTRLNVDQVSALEALFEGTTHPNTGQKKLLSYDLGLDMKTVSIWFQNRRQSMKRSSSSSNSSFISFSALAGASSSAATTPEDAASSLACQSQFSIPPLDSHLMLKIPDVPLKSRQRTVSHRLVLSPVANTTAEGNWRVGSGSSSASVTTHGLGKGKINPRDLWKYLLSSPPSAAEEDTNPDADTVQSTMDKKRSLDWACERQRKRLRESCHQDEISEDAVDANDRHRSKQWNAGIQTGFRKLNQGLALLCVVANCQQSTPGTVTPDVFYGASMLVDFQNSSRMGRRSTHL